MQEMDQNKKTTLQFLRFMFTFTDTSTLHNNATLNKTKLF